MLRQKGSYTNDIETLKKPKVKKKIDLKSSIQQEQVKVSYLQKILKLCVSSLKSIDSSSVSRKNIWCGSFHSHPHKHLQGQNTLVEIGFIELTEPFCKLIYKPFFKHCILQMILHLFYCLYLRGTKFFVLKTELYFIFFWFGLGWHLVWKH